MAKVRGLSIFEKTGLLALCLFGVISILTSALTAYTLFSRMTKEYESKGAAIAQSIASASQEVLLEHDAATVQVMIDQYLEIEGVAYVFVIDAEKVVISHTFVPQMPPRLATLRMSGNSLNIEEVSIEPYGRIIDVSVPILAGVAGYVHVGMDKELIMEYFWAAILEMQALLLTILLLCVGVLYVVTKRISRPLTQLTDYAQRLASHDFTADIEIRSLDEIGLLGRAMKSMSGELAILFAEMESEVAKATGDLREHMTYLSSIIDNLADGLLVVSPAGNVTVVNPAMREFFDLGDKDYVGFASSDVFPIEVFNLSAEVRRCDATFSSAELPLSKGRIGKAVGSSIQTSGPNAQCLGGVILIRDITREKELDQLKVDFISTVSHELRTPMTSVLGFAKIIRKKLDQVVFPAVQSSELVDRTTGQVGDNMDIIVAEAERLTELINDVLDIAKMEAGEVQWHDQVIFMADVVRQSVDSTRGMWREKNIEVVVELDDNLPPVRGDHARLVQVMVNLISNAVKFTGQGPVVCRVHRDGDSILVSVSDKGPGIPLQSQEEIFGKFKQVGDTLTDKPSGTGLGLPICRQIVEYHGGRIWVESEVGEGSMFLFSLPVVNIRSSEEPDEECRGILPDPDSAMLVYEGLKSTADPLILVVDDDPNLGDYLSQVFEAEGFRVRVAINGEDAVALANETIPNLIIMDILMPGMNGRTAIRCLRNNPFTRHIPILVLSALTDNLYSGGDVTLTKPVDDVRLLEIVRALLLEKDIKRSCMVLGDVDHEKIGELTVVSPEKVVFSDPDNIWEHVEAGFKGTVFIPGELGEVLDLEVLSRLPEVVVVVLPVLPNEKNGI